MAAAKATKTLARAERLIATGADVNAKDHVGGTPLGRAVNQGREAMVKLLIDSGADVNIKDDGGWTPLHIAVRGLSELNRANHIAIAEALIAAGAGVNAKDNFDFTPLDYASDPSMAEMLRRRGAVCTSCDLEVLIVCQLIVP